MSLVVPILILCILVLAAGLHVGGAFLLLLSFLLGLLLVLALLSRFARWAAGHGEVGSRKTGHPSDGEAPGDEDLGRVCPDPHCRQVNENLARFCSQCGRPLT